MLENTIPLVIKGNQDGFGVGIFIYLYEERHIKFTKRLLFKLSLTIKPTCTTW